MKTNLFRCLVTLSLALLSLHGVTQKAVSQEKYAIRPRAGETGDLTIQRNSKESPGFDKTIAVRLAEYREQNVGLLSVQEIGLERLPGQITLNAPNKMSAAGQADTNQKSDENANASNTRLAQILSRPGLELYTAAGVGLPLLIDGKAGRQQAVRTVDALLVGGIVEMALKRITRQKRPSGSGYGFPSGHATASFVVATMQSDYRPRQALYWYTGAALISASRVKLRRHYVRDVLAGALIGYAIGRWELSRPRGLILSPLISSNRVNRTEHNTPDRLIWHFNKSF